MEKSIVAILSSDNHETVGYGFIFGYNQIISCAHVVETALGLERGSTKRPSQLRSYTVTVSFPYSKHSNKIFNVSVQKWSPVADLDVATLMIDDDDIPEDVISTKLVPFTAHNDGNLQGSVFGRSETNDEIWVNVEFANSLPNGWIQVNELASGGNRIAKGFSGSPIFSDGRGDIPRGVLGIVVAVDTNPNIRSARMIPSDLLKNRVHTETQRGTIEWAIQFFRSTTLTALLNDLVKLETQGLADEECVEISQTLQLFLNVLTNFDDNETSKPFWSSFVHTDLEDFNQLYLDWNDVDGNLPENIKMRREVLRELRKKRREISSKIKGSQKVLSLESDEVMFVAIFDQINKVCSILGDKFPNLCGALMQYNKRKGNFGDSL